MAKNARFFFRDSPKEGVEGIQVSDRFDTGAVGPNGGMSYLVTKWITLNPARHRWLFDPMDLVGKYASVVVKGTSLGYEGALIDLDFSLVDSAHTVLHSLSMKTVPLEDPSYQIGGFSVKGKVRRVPDAFLENVLSDRLRNGVTQ
ncbi:hypothetical protein [Alkalilimnicola sp. S0819]|uniref:hypothetical protein n=1 Tax=Alkalilimnicola sp. S0819 TaxID=2613922 RepID=UPI00126187CE|nr:hypothetical protein [Alkalilimnicola sp. S0819]KAB7624143.1 hypothetical protein F3N43_07070 [Alkalilimnicola sp. S0819]MPQ16396.1 hypothetical protein [Alkalilimnicola sp. S0819]